MGETSALLSKSSQFEKGKSTMNAIRFLSLKSNQQPNYVFRCDQELKLQSKVAAHGAADRFVFHYKRLRDVCEGGVLGGGNKMSICLAGE